MSVTLTILSQTRCYLSVVINISAILAVFLQKQAPRSDCNTICLSKISSWKSFLPTFVHFPLSQQLQDSEAALY